MSKTKAGGSTKNLRDSKPKYLGTKLYDGEKAQIGSVLVRQRGTKILPGKNTRAGKDHTIFATKDGTVKYTEKRKTGFNSQTRRFKVANVE